MPRGPTAGSEKIEQWLGGVGLGTLAGELRDLQLGQLLDTLPPGADEALAISKARPAAPLMRWGGGRSTGDFFFFRPVGFRKVKGGKYSAYLHFFAQSKILNFVFFA